MTYDLEKLRLHIAGRLTPKRYNHSVEVQKAATRLAKHYGIDWYKAGVAGLLHDVCHDMSYGDQLNYLRSCGILPDDLTLENPPLWHAIAGSVYVRDALGIDDEEIASAIRWHTSGRAEMSMMEKVVYVADLVSNDRDSPDLPMLREMAGQSLDTVMLYSLRYTLGRILHKGYPLVREAWEAYNYYLIKENELDQENEMKREKESCG